MYRLVIADDQGNTREVKVTGDELTIGRNPDQGIRLEDQNISRIHTRLRVHSNCLLLDDLSRYGTLVNSIRVKGVHVLRQGDQIQVGDYRITVKDLPDYLQGTDYGDLGLGGQARLTITGNDTYPALGGGGAHGSPLHSRLSGGGVGDQHRVTKPCLIQKPLDGGGQETRHLLDDPEILIGSDPDNHIILSHPTVNAKHAKILNMGSRSSLLAQGQSVVTINGEEVGAKDLETGDVIGIGVIQLEFELPGQDLDDELGTGDDSTGKYRAVGGFPLRTPLIIGAAAIGALAIGLILVFGPGGGGDKGRGDDVLTGGEGAGRGDAMDTVTHDFAHDPDLGEELDLDMDLDTPEDALLARINELMDERNWGGATGLIEQVLKDNPDSEEASLLKAKVTEELTNRDHFRQLTELASKNKLKEVTGVLARITPDSVYRPEGERIEGELKAEFIHNRLQGAEDAFNHQDYQWAMDYADEILQVEDDNREALRIKLRASLALKKSGEEKAAAATKARPATGATASAPSAPVPVPVPVPVSVPVATPRPGESKAPQAARQGTTAGTGAGAHGGAASRKAPPRPSPAAAQGKSPPKAGAAASKRAGAGGAPKAMSREEKRAQAEQYYAAGRTFFRQNNHRQARENLLKATQLDPGLGDPHFYLGHIYLNENQIDKACFHLKKLLQLSPNSRLAPGTQDAVKRIGCQ